MFQSVIGGILNYGVWAVLLLAGIAVTAMGRRNHGSAALIGMFGCILLLVGVAFNAFTAYVVYPSMDSPFGATIFITNLISLVLHASGTGLLIWAVVARRKPSQPAQPPQGPQGPGWQQHSPNWQEQQQQPFQQQQPGWQNPPQQPYGGGQG
ncbi:hypothetical protein [Nonomuraea sp. NPDC049400]|uniref:hypothetical protein n=1 Tax=Nonomuraea sp. NPDC049400 TaxID=3364352 RepID=UPI00378CB106